jgi:hypothetical protein
MRNENLCGATRNPRSILEELLLASLVCGLTPDEAPAHRLHIFFAANHDLGFGTHRNTYQRVIETGVDELGYWVNSPTPGLKGSGEYRITQSGHQLATREFGTAVTARYTPTATVACRFSMEGMVGRNRLVITSRSAQTTVSVDGSRLTCKEAYLRITQENANVERQAVRNAAIHLYDLGVDHGFAMRWEGSASPSPPMVERPRQARTSTATVKRSRQSGAPKPTIKRSRQSGASTSTQRAPETPAEPRLSPKAQLKQDVFQRYESKCALCSIEASQLLTPFWLIDDGEDGPRQASHALLLCTLHDRAMRLGLIVIDPTTFNVVCRAAFDTAGLRIDVDNLMGLTNKPSATGLIHQWTAWHAK